MRKKILKKIFFSKNWIAIFWQSASCWQVWCSEIFKEALGTETKRQKFFGQGKLFLKKFYLQICILLTSFLSFILSNCMFWTLLTVIIFGLSSRNIRKMRKNMRKTKVAKEFFWTFLLSFPLNLHVFHMFILNKFLIRPLRGFENNKRTLWQKTFYSQKE